MTYADNGCMNRTRTEEGIVLTWLFQVTLVIAVVGLLLFEAGSIAWNYFGTDTEAREIALELSDRIESVPASRIEQEGKRLAREAGGRLVSLEVYDDRVEVTFRREATTIIVSRVDAIADWGKASATGSAPIS